VEDTLAGGIANLATSRDGTLLDPWGLDNQPPRCSMQVLRCAVRASPATL